MKTVSLTEARRGLSELIATGQSVQITNRGLPFGSLRLFAVATVDREKVKEAARRIREIGSKYKPSKKYGATAMVRELRDDGDR